MLEIRDFELRDIKEDNLKQVLEWRNSPRVKNVMNSNHNITWENHLRWFKSIKENTDKEVYVVTYKGKPIGVVSLQEISKEHNRCEWGFYIGDKEAPKGSGTILGILALNKAFNEMNLYKVCAQVLSTNKVSFQFHKKLGFEYEGRLVDHIKKENNYIDVLQLALFQSKWEGIRYRLMQKEEG
ncbi:UDP-4-amino-4,6-dideoxy-N-acetyl-beta-L-altrosamine N-acetyltransferase [Ornithinibacillus massiliensis]|uniref:UDP-4-amino-4, 6-dideoxy-N-acetyl-beta-L-altrosamine N-acetyltransferase n=1 Tax=Ornithinibacillus massiliensis TaxID=1944633 RepID=A0ABS5MGC6_9BACI|nr:UDP-4-amino-4,6-dideoxy-N-acetyl-beta-L-altrosamine N-acetyltransferase [Ornithinibacillus massiliensis]MBS3681215.1 UDP-4-amino-4,6-dideoxy-N-acetyl-beta-L-altrosamine N-acetyltransferase [Ornithinibacillus massiliensis]